ncbi:CDP-alcohol phosphatidyltransferase family protein [Amaricoccus macauensis]|uniref:CDP-alcohol phosphatidyltransferase family protein n=1 Tax=Amaricoccus macauensis TaxID=57001 RepID=UPI003C7A193E
MRTKPSAFAVHLFTATGAALALLALVAASAGEWRAMFLWLGIGLVVDGIDGPLARKFDVKRNAANWDGTILDLVIDYLTYVFIPAFALIGSGLVPGIWAMPAALFMCLTSVIYYADTRMKAQDNSFVGFPGVWHMPLLVLFVTSPPGWFIVLFVLLLGLGQFTGLKFIHPVRTRRWRPANLAVLMLWFLLAALSVFMDFNAPPLQHWLLVATSLWLLFAGILMQIIPPDEVKEADEAGEPRFSDA